MRIDFLREVFTRHARDEAIVWCDRIFTYQDLLDLLTRWHQRLEGEGVAPGAVVAVEADFSPNGVALVLALIEREATFVPLTSSVRHQHAEFIAIAQAEVLVRIGEGDDATVEPLGRSADHEYYRELRRRGHAGLVLFSSGSTGASKAAVHDFVHLLEKFTVPRHRQRMMSFLQYDHIGGMNTLLYSLANAGCLVTVSSRDPDAVLEAIERHRVELLPTSPTFVNLILLSRAYERHDLRSLRTVTYGTEPMLESTLKRFHEVCPDVRLLQTYGLSEVGILRSKSKSSDSLWVKIGGEGFETRVVDGVLHIKARSAMLGYLNAASPFTDDGWFNTGDAVEVDGDYVRILGRLSELINVGGLKVYPTEVENVIQEMDNVAEVTVFGRRNPIVGNMVCARVRLRQDEDRRAFATRLKQHCAARLEKYKVPVKVIVDQERQYGERFKKQRSGNA